MGDVGAEHEVQGGELFPTLAVSCRASVVMGEEAGQFHHCCDLSVFCGRHFNCRQPSYYEFIQYCNLGTSLLQILRSYTLLLKPLVLICYDETMYIR